MRLNLQKPDDEKIEMFIILLICYTYQRNSTNHKWQVYP
jgi:hypothetical protein